MQQEIIFRIPLHLKKMPFVFYKSSPLFYLILFQSTFPYIILLVPKIYVLPPCCELGTNALTVSSLLAQQRVLRRAM